MTEEEFNGLLGKWIDGEISVEEAQRLEIALQEEPGRRQRMKEELWFADVLEQQLCPWRSFDSFVNGLETRLHAEETGDEFIRELIPKLREVDRRKKAVARPRQVVTPRAGTNIRSIWRSGWWWTSVGGSLAAAATLVWIFAVRGTIIQPVSGRAPVASITEMEGVVWQPEEQPIEWKVGDQLKAGEGVRLLSGRARFRMSNGNLVTVEGPADLEFLSASEGILRQGAVMADAPSGAKPFRVHGLGAEITVESGSTGVRMEEGDRVEAKMMAKAEHGTEERVSTDPGEKEATGGPTSEHSGTTHDGKPEAPAVVPRYRIEGEGAPVLLVLEDDDLRPMEPIRVDVVPGTGAAALASHESPEKRPAIESVSKVRSYLVQVGDAPKAKGSGQDGDYVDATVRFDREILGVSTMEDTLEKGDQLTGYDPQQRLGSASEWKRGLKPPNDFVHIREDGRTLDLRVRKRDGERIPQLRVFVKGE